MAVCYSAEQRQAARINGPREWTTILRRYSPDVVTYYLRTKRNGLTFRDFLASGLHLKAPALAGKPLFKDVDLYLLFNSSEEGTKLIRRKGKFRFNPSNKSGWWNELNSRISAYAGYPGKRVELTLHSQRLGGDAVSLGRIYNAQPYEIVASVSPDQPADNYTPTVPGQQTSAAAVATATNPVTGGEARGPGLIIIASSSTTIVTTTAAPVQSNSNGDASERDRLLALRQQMRQQLKPGQAATANASIGASVDAPKATAAAHSSEPANLSHRMVEHIASYMASRASLKLARAPANSTNRGTTKLAKSKRMIHDAIGSALDSRETYGRHLGQNESIEAFWQKRGQSVATVATHVAQAVGDSMQLPSTSFLPRKAAVSDTATVERHAKDGYKHALIGTGIFERLDNWLSQFDDDHRDPGGNDLGPTRRLTAPWVGCRPAPAAAPAAWDGYRLSGWRPASIDHSHCLPDHHVCAPQQQQQQQQTVVINAPAKPADDCHSDSSDDEAVNPYQNHCSSDSDGSDSDNDNNDCCEHRVRRSHPCNKCQCSQQQKPKPAAAAAVVVQQEEKKVEFDFASASNFMGLFRVAYNSLKVEDRAVRIVVALPYNDVFTEPMLGSFVVQHVQTKQTVEERSEVCRRFVKHYTATRVDADRRLLVNHNNRIFSFVSDRSYKHSDYPNVEFYPVRVIHNDAPKIM